MKKNYQISKLKSRITRELNNVTKVKLSEKNYNFRKFKKIRFI